MFYAGIGSRSTPRDAWDQLFAIGRQLAQQGYICRTGGADGADTAFELAHRAYTLPGGKPSAEIYLPWEGFNGRKGIVCGDDPYFRALAEEFHPAWDSCSRGAKALHTRNVPQVLGQQESPASAFVVCWTPEGKGGGGTGQALRIAHFCGIPVYDLAIPGDRERFSAEVLKL